MMTPSQIVKQKLRKVFGNCFELAIQKTSANHSVRGLLEPKPTTKKAGDSDE